MINLTEDELRKIFTEVGNELKENLDLTALIKDFEEKSNAVSSDKEKGVLIGKVLAVMFNLNQEYLFRILVKVLCKH